MSGLECLALKTATHKVKVLEFHVTQPWIAMADKNQVVTIWDYSTDQVVFESQLGAADDKALQDAMLQRLAEKEPSYYGAFTSSTMVHQKAVPSGSVRSLKFLDTETCYWQLALQQQRQYRGTSATGIPYLGRVRGLKGHRWLVAACEAKIVMMDLVAATSREVPRSILDGKAPTCLAFLFTHTPFLLGYSAGEEGPTVISPVMAVGTAAGTIYLISISTLQVYARLAGHKAGVTCLLPLGSREAGGADLLLSAAQEGSMALWDPSGTPPKGPDKEVAPKGTFKAHEGEVTDMAYFQGVAPGGALAPLCILTSGADKKVAVWEVGSWKEVARHKPLARGAVDALASSPRGAAACGLEPNVLMVSGEAPVVWGMTIQLPGGSRHQTVSSLLNLEPVLPPGLKKVAKLYNLVVHPLQPQLVAVGHNTGVALLTFDPHGQPPVAAIPLLHPTPEDLDEEAASTARTYGGNKFRGCQYLLTTDTTLCHVYVKPAWVIDANGRQVSADLLGRKSVFTYPPRAGRPYIGVSFDGAYASIVWPQAREYTILAATGNRGWESVASGSGTCVVWAHAAPTFAVLHIPQAAVPQAAKKKGGWSGRKAAEAEAHMQAALAAAEAAALAATAVQVFTMIPEETKIGASMNLVCENVVMGSDAPVALFGGALLGIVLNRQLKSGGRQGRAMCFYSWSSFSAVGEAIAEPKLVAWDPDVAAVALAYDDALVLCRTQPAFTAFTTLALAEVTAATWHRQQLFVATPTSVFCVFVAAGADVAAPYAEIIKIASLGGGVVSQMAAAGDASASLPSESLRPPGPVVIVGLRQGVLWLVDVRGQPFVIPMSHPGLRSRTLAANGNTAAARALAERALWRDNHDELAAFMTVLAPRAAAADAASLSGLSVRGEAGLAAVGGQLRRALHALDAAAQGATDRSALNSFPRWRQRVSNNPISEGWRTPPFPPNSPLLQPSEPADLSDDLLALNLDESGEPKEAIDWDAPLKAATAPPRPRAVGAPDGGASSSSLPAFETPPRSGDGAGPPGDTGGEDVSPEEAARIADLADEALALSSAAYNSGIRDVAVGSLRILLRGAAALPPDTLQTVLLRAARLDMTAELHAFAAGLAARRVQAPPDLAALAAALTDSPTLVKGVLESAGLVAQSAVYTHAWRSGSALQATQAWSSALASVASPGVHVTVAAPSM